MTYEQLLIENISTRDKRIAELELASINLINACAMHGVGNLEEVSEMFELLKEQGK